MIDKLNINLLDATDEDYKKARAEFILNKTTWGSTKDQAEAQWDVKFPRGKDDWINDHEKLTSSGQQRLINKINELVDVINNMTKDSSGLKKHLESLL